MAWPRDVLGYIGHENYEPGNAGDHPNRAGVGDFLSVQIGEGMAVTSARSVTGAVISAPERARGSAPGSRRSTPSCSVALASATRSSASPDPCC